MMFYSVVYSQINLGNSNSQIGMSYYNLLKYHGEPQESYSVNRYKVVVYLIDFDLGALSEEYRDYFGKSYSFLMMKDNIVIGNIVKLKMYNFEMLQSWYKTSKKVRIDGYKQEPTHETQVYSAWNIYSAGLNETLTEIIMMGFDPSLTNNWGIIGSSRKNDFDKLQLILESNNFTSK